MLENKPHLTLKVFINSVSNKTKHYLTVNFNSQLLKGKSTAEGKGLSEASVGLESNFLLTTTNAEGEQCYNERDCVTIEIKNQQGHDCATEV